jgi:acetoin utilization deacetylase AcuC-like enzyme
MRKYLGLRDFLLEQRICERSQLVEPRPARESELCRAHHPAYVRAILDNRLGPTDERELGLPMSAALARRARASNGGTIEAARLALQGGLACNLAGGSHHAFTERPSGFCVFNDVAVAAMAVLAETDVARILVIDLDVHQGDGTAVMLADVPEIFTFSLHCRTNFPARKQQSSLDVTLDAGAGDDDYLAVLKAVLPFLIETVRPELVFYNAGVDTHVADRLGRLALTDRGLEAREAFVVSEIRGRRIPMACVLGGGYSSDVDDVVRRHAILHRVIGQSGS